MTLPTDHDTKRESWEYFLLRAARSISLTEAQYEKIDDRYKVLKDILDASASPLLEGAHIFVQGSVGLRTTIKPLTGAPADLSTVDADAIVLLCNADGASAEAVLDEIYDRISEGTRVEAEVKLLRRGVRIIYADTDPGFHIDITPARTVPGNMEKDGQGKLEVPDRELMAWKASSPIPYLYWLDAATKKEIALESIAVLSRKMIAMDAATQAPLPEYEQYIDSDPLRAAIKLLKRHRDEWAVSSGDIDHRPISAVITTLATRAYEDVAADSQNRPRKPLDAILEIVENMPAYIRHENGQYLVCNPKDGEENFAEKWNRRVEGPAYVRAFHQWHHSAKESMSVGLQEFPSAEAFNNAINERFGLGGTFVAAVNNEIPSDWTMPGRPAGHTRNVASIAAVFGNTGSGSESQDAAESLDRLG